MNGEAVNTEIAAASGQSVAASILTKPRPEVLAVISILMGAIAQLIMKGALLMWGAHANIVPPAAGVFLGLAVYAAGTLFWWKAVARASISYLYPLSAGSYALVALGGRFFFQESIQTGRWIGIGVITLGVAIMAFSNLRGSE